MERRPSQRDSDGSKVPNWLLNRNKEEDDKDEIVYPHTPTKKQKGWAYTLREGGQKYKASLPTSDEQIAKVKQQLLNPHNWRLYVRSPYGGDRSYTQINCFPPYDYIRVAEVFLPNGEVWNSRLRRFLTPQTD